MKTTLALFVLAIALLVVGSSQTPSVHRYTQVDVQYSASPASSVTLNEVPVIEVPGKPPESLDVVRNGFMQAPGVDYAFVAPRTVTFLPASKPRQGDTLLFKFSYLK